MKDNTQTGEDAWRKFAKENRSEQSATEDVTDNGQKGGYDRQQRPRTVRRSFNPNFTDDNRLKEGSESREGGYEHRSYGDRPSGDRPYGERKQYGDRKPYGEHKSYGDRKPYGDRPSGDRPYGERKQYGDKPYGEHKSYGDRKPYGDRPSGDRPYGERKQYGDKPYGEHKSYGDRKPYGDRPSGDRPYGERKQYGDKPYGEHKSYGDRKPYGDRPSGDRPYGERKQYGDKPYGEHKSYGDRKPYGERKQYGDKPYGEHKSYGDRKPYGDRPSGDRPYGERKQYGDKPYGEHKSYGDRKPYGEHKSYGDRKPYGSKPYGERKQYGDRPYGERRTFDRKPRTPRDGYEKKDFDSEAFANASASIVKDYPRYDAPATTEQIRLNKFIAQSGLCSRREADEYITSGAVTVNGEVVREMGVKIQPTDKVCFNGEPLSGEKLVYILMNKPKGFVTSIEDPHADKTVMQLVQNACSERIYPVGRLDKNSVGVLLLTNDGELTKQLTHPSYNHRKVYEVTLNKAIVDADTDKLVAGVTLEDGEISADELAVLDETRKVVGVEIHSGRNRIVRRMFESLGYAVEKLDRVYFAGLTKKNLKRGQWRFLTDAEVSMLKSGQYE